MELNPDDILYEINHASGTAAAEGLMSAILLLFQISGWLALAWGLFNFAYSIQSSNADKKTKGVVLMILGALMVAADFVFERAGLIVVG